MQFKSIRVNTVILGGGIAGLWLLNQLRQQGVEAILLESAALGAGQTGCSQGIIHGGAKYALSGLLNRASQSIADMPQIWHDCLHGDGEINLTAARILSKAQYMWTNRNLAAQAKIYLASYFLRGRCEILTPDQYPPVFQQPGMKGHVYQLAEKVIDVYSLLSALARPYESVILQAKKENLSFKVGAEGIEAIDYAHDGNVFRLEADNYVLTAGEGIEHIISRAVFLNTPMQRRPLRMTLLEFDGLHPLYAHCVGRGNTPLLTITSHLNHYQRWVWYVGGDIAETGAKLDAEMHERLLTQRLKKCLPWLSFYHLKMKSFLINRAEPYQKDHRRPSLPYVKRSQNMTVVWPTKLAFAPLLPALVHPGLMPSSMPSHGFQHLSAWPKAVVASPIWNLLS